MRQSHQESLRRRLLFDFPKHDVNGTELLLVGIPNISLRPVEFRLCFVFRLICDRLKVVGRFHCALPYLALELFGFRDDAMGHFASGVLRISYDFVNSVFSAHVNVLSARRRLAPAYEIVNEECHGDHEQQMYHRAADMYY